MRLSKFLLLFSIPLLFTACDAFEKAGDINDYVGNYVVDTAHERTYHIYWSQKTFINEKNINPPIGTKIIISADKKVQYITKDGETKTGKVKCLEKYIRLTNIPIDSTYKFYKRNGNKLEYSHESTHFGVEYDVTYRTIGLYKEV